MEGVPDSLNNARFRLIALGACGRNDTSQATILMVAPTSAAIGLVLPQFPACTTGQYSLPLLVDSLYNVSALSLRFTYNPDSVQFLSVAVNFRNASANSVERFAMLICRFCS